MSFEFNNFFMEVLVSIFSCAVYWFSQNLLFLCLAGRTGLDLEPLLYIFLLYSLVRVSSLVLFPFPLQTKIMLRRERNSAPLNRNVLEWSRKVDYNGERPLWQLAGARSLNQSSGSKHHVILSRITWTIFISLKKHFTRIFLRL